MYDICTVYILDILDHNFVLLLQPFPDRLEDPLYLMDHVMA